MALKLAVYPRDPRFEREAVLLSRIRHPSVPRLLEAGQWKHASGFMHPFLVMEWIDGEPLYTWSSRRNVSSRQVMRLLSQGAGALRATHMAANAVHRDVKGGNVLVQPVSDRLFLMDFGSGHYKGAERLTDAPVPPGTPAYMSPQVWDFARQHGHLPLAHYVARPADDVFAFGVMAYRLVTDEYPPMADSSLAESQCWRPGGGGPRRPKELNPRVDPELDALILRMLSVMPEERVGTEEIAKALGRRAEQAGPGADVPLFEWETLPRSEWPPEDAQDSRLVGHRVRRREREEVQAVLQADATARADVKQPKVEAPTHDESPRESTALRERMQTWLPWLAVGAVCAVALWHHGTGPGRAETESPQAQGSSDAGERDGGVVSVGDTALTSSSSSVKEVAGSPAEGVIAVDSPPKPLPGQLKPDANGHCRKGQSAINGGCWLEAKVSLDDCPGNGFAYKGGCYVPVFPSSREPTSAPRK